MKKNAFTLTEILIAAALLSLVLLAAFSLSSMSTKSFEEGNWRITTQKQARLFLLKFKETMQQANHAYFIEPDGLVRRVQNSGGASDSRDITIAQDYYGKIASSANTALLFASSTKPARRAVPELGIKEEKGVYKGISIECYNKTLCLFQTGNDRLLHPDCPISACRVQNSSFVEGDTSGDFIIELKDVDSIGFFVAQATESKDINHPEMLLTCDLTMVKPRTESAAKINESITVRIPNRRSNEIVAGKALYPVMQHKKAAFTR